MRIKISPLLLRTLVLAVVAALVLAIPAPTQVSSAPIGNSVLARAVDIELGLVGNPLDDDNLIAGQNDSRLGFNHCGYDWSFDGGKTWGDQTPPFWQFTLLDGHTADACSDPSATFDSKGNAYVTGVIFDVAA